MCNFCANTIEAKFFMMCILLFKKVNQKIEFIVEPSRNDVLLNTINEILICFKIQIDIQYSILIFSCRFIFVVYFLVRVVVKFLRSDYE